METSFKTCVFGGFDREDVISYIRKTAEESQKKLEALMEETERLRVRCETAESELSALRARSAELERLRTEEETLRRENETLRGPAAQYQSLKDHIADIEISAHRRTEEFRGKAIAELMELVDGQRRWCTQQEAAYRQMNEGILAELRKAQCCVEECDLGNFQQFQESLRQLAETINGGE